MEDISVNVGEHLLNFRVSALFRKGNKILTHHTIGESHYTLPGGRVKEGETTEQALIREMGEEMGKHIKIVKLVSFMENLFTFDDKKYHELLVTYEAEFEDKETYNKEKMQSIEKDKKLEFTWIDINELEKLDFRPNVLIKVIKQNDGKFNHIINVEQK